MKLIIILFILLNSNGLFANSRIVIKNAITLESVSYNVSELTKTKTKSIKLYPNVICTAKVFLYPRRIGDFIVKTWVLMCEISKIKVAPTFPCIKHSNGFIETYLAETYVDNGTGGKRISFVCGEF